MGPSFAVVMRALPLWRGGGASTLQPKVGRPVSSIGGTTLRSASGTIAPRLPLGLAQTPKQKTGLSPPAPASSPTLESGVSSEVFKAMRT
jgi:hypothetical protein